MLHRANAATTGVAGGEGARSDPGEGGWGWLDLALGAPNPAAVAAPTGSMSQHSF